MTGPALHYESLIEDALRSVVRRALAHVSEHGLPAGRALYITYRSQAPGVELPDHLLARYPTEITIVLEHQFWNLAADENEFRVTLSFNKRPENLIVPYSALVRFADPVAKFGVQFEQGKDTPIVHATAPAGVTDAETAPGVEGDNVVAIDAFRKK